MQTISTLFIFTLSLLMIFIRPRGMHEAWATIIGGSMMLVFGLVSWSEAWQTVMMGKDVIFFLFTLMLLSSLLDRSGFFDWAAIIAARAARGKAASLPKCVLIGSCDYGVSFSRYDCNYFNSHCAGFSDKA